MVRKALKAVLIIGLTAFFGTEAKALNLGGGEMTTYVPIPSYGYITGDFEKQGNNCYWDVQVGVKQVGGKLIKLKELKLQSPYLCELENQSSSTANSGLSWLQAYSNSKPVNPGTYLKEEAGVLNSEIQTIFQSLEGKIGSNTGVFSFHYRSSQYGDWYYTGSVIPGFVLSYGWQKKPNGNYLAFYYNSTAGKISDQAPKPTDKPDSLPVLNSTGNSGLDKKATELNSKVRGGYEKETYENNQKTAETVVSLNHKYDTFAEDYTDKACNGQNVNYQAAKVGKGITAFEKDVVIPSLQRENKTEAVVAFFYSPTIYSLDDDTVERKLEVVCPSGYSYDCSGVCKKVEKQESTYKDEKGNVYRKVTYKVLTAQPEYYFDVNHEIAAHLSRTVRVDTVTADGKVVTLYNTELKLPDYTYHVRIRKQIQAKTLDDAVNQVKGKTLSDEDCTYGQLVPYSGNTPLETPKCLNVTKPADEVSLIKKAPNQQNQVQTVQTGVVTNQKTSFTNAAKPTISPRSNSCSTFEIALGRIGDNYWKGYCKIFTLRTSFYVKNPADIYSLRLIRAKFDDYIAVYLNGNPVYVGPYGGNRLELVNEKRCFKVYVECDWHPGVPDSILKKSPNTILGWCYYIKCVPVTLVDYGTGIGSCELSTSWDKYPNIDITPYIKQGVNDVLIKVEVYGGGEGYVFLKGEAKTGTITCLERDCRVINKCQ